MKRFKIEQSTADIVSQSGDKKGQILLTPEIELEGWWTSLSVSEKDIVQLYADHGMSEQFHSEFKTDLDVERLPSGKFATNALVLGVSMLAYNVLRWIGQSGLLGGHSLKRHKAKRRRIKTVMIAGAIARVAAAGARHFSKSAVGALAVLLGRPFIAKLVIILIMSLFIYMAWITRKSRFEKFEKIDSVFRKNYLHHCFFVFALGCNSVIFFIAFIWNPLVLTSAILDLQMAHLDRLVPSIFGLSQFESQFILSFVSGMFISTYWERSFLWRYLTDEAKKEHRWLQWPYRIGFMKDEIV